MTKLAIFGLFFSTVAFAADPRNWEAAGIATVAIGVDGGALKIVASDAAAKIELHELDQVTTECMVHTKRTGDRLAISIDRPSIAKVDCTRKWELVLPSRLAIEANAGSAPIAIGNAKGRVVVQSGSGAIAIAGDIALLDVKSGSGTVEVKGLRGAATVRTATGDVHIIYSYAPSVGVLDIVTGSASAEVTLPANAKVQTQFASATGRKENSHGDTPGAPFTISFRSGSGSLAVH